MMMSVQYGTVQYSTVPWDDGDDANPKDVDGASAMAADVDVEADGVSRSERKFRTSFSMQHTRAKFPASK